MICFILWLFLLRLIIILYLFFRWFFIWYRVVSPLVSSPAFFNFFYIYHCFYFVVIVVNKFHQLSKLRFKQFVFWPIFKINWIFIIIFITVFRIVIIVATFLKNVYSLWITVLLTIFICKRYTFYQNWFSSLFYFWLII